MPRVPVLAFPIALGADGQLATVEQGSPADVAGCIALALSYEPGQRRGKPNFGCRSQEFDDRVDVQAIRSAVLADEPRAQGVGADVVAEAAGLVGIEVEFSGVTL